MGDKVDGAVTKKPSFVSRFLDVLYEIKFKLALKKIEGKTNIAKQELKTIIEEEATKDLDVREAIDKLFEPLNIFKKDDAGHEMKDKDASNDMGIAKTKALPAFKNTNNNVETQTN